MSHQESAKGGTKKRERAASEAEGSTPKPSKKKCAQKTEAPPPETFTPFDYSQSDLNVFAGTVDHSSVKQSEHIERQSFKSWWLCFIKVPNQRTTHSLIRTGKTVILRKRSVPSFSSLNHLVPQWIDRFNFFYPTEIAQGPEIQCWTWRQKYVLPGWKIRKVKYQKEIFKEKRKKLYMWTLQCINSSSSSLSSFTGDSDITGPKDKPWLWSYFWILFCRNIIFFFCFHHLQYLMILFFKVFFPDMEQQFTL